MHHRGDKMTSSMARANLRRIFSIMSGALLIFLGLRCRLGLSRDCTHLSAQ